MEKRIEELTIYFSRYKSNNMYYVAIKHHVAMHLMKKGFKSSTIGRILNVDHSTVLHYRDKYTAHDWAGKFIEQNFDRYLAESIYPHSGNYKKRLKEKHIKPNGDIKVTTVKRECNAPKTLFGMPQKYVDICEVFGMGKKNRDDIIQFNRNYLILYLKVEYDVPDKYLQSLFNISHSAIINALGTVREKINKVDPMFYKHTEVLRYILHNGDTRTGKIFLWSKGQGKPPGCYES